MDFKIKCLQCGESIRCDETILDQQLACGDCGCPIALEHYPRLVKLKQERDAALKAERERQKQAKREERQQARQLKAAENAQRRAMDEQIPRQPSVVHRYVLALQTLLKQLSYKKVVAVVWLLIVLVVYVLWDYDIAPDSVPSTAQLPLLHLEREYLEVLPPALSHLSDLTPATSSDEQDAYGERYFGVEGKLLVYCPRVQYVDRDSKFLNLTLWLRLNSKYPDDITIRPYDYVVYDWDMNEYHPRELDWQGPYRNRSVWDHTVSPEFTIDIIPLKIDYLFLKYRIPELPANQTRLFFRHPDPDAEYVFVLFKHGD